MRPAKDVFPAFGSRPRPTVKTADRLTESGADVVTAPLGPDPTLAAMVIDRCDAVAPPVPIPSTPVTVAGEVGPGG